jgi:alpha-beta hydrolase superfamily lysophospholipase
MQRTEATDALVTSSNQHVVHLALAGGEMAAVRVPVLAVVGSIDPALAGVNELKAAMPSLKVVVIEGASHISADERGAPRRPEFVNASESSLQRINRLSAA